jgi:leader peptidase (prepilin peptidase)/N-methyltransferase
MLPVMIFLGVILVIDIEYRVVLIQTSIFGLVLMFLIGLVNQGFTLPGLLITLAGGAAGLIILLALYYFGAFFSKTLSKARGQQIDEIAFGFGDVYAGTFLGLMMGWPNIIGTLILAVLLSGAFSLLYVLVLLILRRYKAFSAIPYTPFLILGAIVLPYLIK